MIDRTQLKDATAEELWYAMSVLLDTLEQHDGEEARCLVIRQAVRDFDARQSFRRRMDEIRNGHEATREQFADTRDRMKLLRDSAESINKIVGRAGSTARGL